MNKLVIVWRNSNIDSISEQMCDCVGGVHLFIKSAGAKKIVEICMKYVVTQY